MNSSFRSQFPSLDRQVNGQQAIFLDGPAGTQMPMSVIDAISNYYKTSNANTHGQFLTSHETDELMSATREQCAVFLNAESGDCISFGQNMTSLCFSLSRGIGRLLKPGDEIVLTQLDHEANRGPWLTLQNQGIIVREILLRDDGTLDYEDAAVKINPKTRLVATGLASNMLGTVNNVQLLRKLSTDAGALFVVDAVHYAPHFLTDAQALGCDFLMCSAYKFYGPHVGVLYSKPEVLDKIPVDRLRVQDQRPPYMIETGTLNHAAFVGVRAAIEFIASVGSGAHLRAQLESAFELIRKHEYSLAHHLWNQLSSVPGIQLYGQDFEKNTLRAPTIAFSIEGMMAQAVCKELASHNIFAWDGHFYAIRAAEVLGTLDKGVVRMGVVAYNTMEEIEYVGEQLEIMVN